MDRERNKDSLEKARKALLRMGLGNQKGQEQNRDSPFGLSIMALDRSFINTSFHVQRTQAYPGCGLLHGVHIGRGSLTPSANQILSLILMAFSSCPIPRHHFVLPCSSTMVYYFIIGPTVTRSMSHR